MNRRKTIILIIYTIVFYALWAVWEWIGKAMTDRVFTNEIVCQFVKSGIVKNLVWTIPAVILISHFKDEMHITLKEMFTSKVNWLKYLPIFILFTVYLFAGAIMQGEIAVAEGFGIDKLIIVLFVGLTEEIVFRGWLLNATVSDSRKCIPILVNAVMFLAIHFPLWIRSGIFVSAFVQWGFLEVLILSIIFSWVFIKSRNILVPIALHMYWDLLVFIFYE